MITMTTNPTMMTATTNWRDLIVTDAEGDTVGTLGEVMDYCPANLDSATISGGKIVAWPQFFLSSDGEETDWNTPRGAVNWDGFGHAWAIASGQSTDAE